MTVTGMNLRNLNVLLLHYPFMSNPTYCLGCATQQKCIYLLSFFLQLLVLCPVHKKKMKKKMNLFGYTYKIYDIGYKTEMMSKECNAGDPLETPGGLYRGPPSNENTIFKKMYL